MQKFQIFFEVLDIPDIFFFFFFGGGGGGGVNSRLDAWPKPTYN